MCLYTNVIYTHYACIYRETDTKILSTVASLSCSVHTAVLGDERDQYLFQGFAQITLTAPCHTFSFISILHVPALAAESRGQ